MNEPIVPPAALPPPPMMAPPPPAEKPPLEMSPTDVGLWWQRIESDRKKRKLQSDKWKKLLKSYLPPDGTEDVNSNIHFRNAHLKISEVWAQFPELKLTPLAPLAAIVDPTTNQPTSPDTIVAIKKAVLNKLLGRDYANVDLTIREALFDIFATSGIAAMKICYQADVQITKEMQPGPPVPAPGSILGLSDVPGPPTLVDIPTVVNEKVRWYRFSPEKLGIPSGWRSTDFDAAPYLFMEFVERNTANARRRYKLPDDFKGTTSRDDRLVAEDLDPQGGNADLLQGIEVWLHASEYDPDVANTDVFYRLVLIEGMREKPAVYERSPYQTIDEKGALTPDSMIGNPIHPMTLRVATDTAWIPADAAFTDPLVRKENTWLRQDSELREANIPRFLHADSITTQIDKLRDLTTGQGVGIPDEKAMLGMDRLVLPLPHLERAQSDTQGLAHIQQANTETLGLGSNQGGAYRSHQVSATEVATTEKNVSVRLKGEQSVSMGRILQGVRKFDALVQRYMTEPDYVSLVGENGAMQWMQYTNAHLAGRFSYDIFEDTQLTMDQQTRISRMTNFVNFFAKSPFLNQSEVLRLGAQEFGYDPARMVQQPPPPAPPPPEKPRVSIALQASDLAIPEVRLLLKQDGLDLTMMPMSPELAAAHAAEQAKALPHGGGVAKADLVDKHHSDLTGKQDGTPPLAGAQAQGMPPGSRVQ